MTLASRVLRVLAPAWVLLALVVVGLAACSVLPPIDDAPSLASGGEGTPTPHVSEMRGLEPTASYLAEQDELWEMVVSMFPDAERPDTRIVRYITPDEWGTSIASCMTEAGFSTEVLPDGGVRPAAVPPEQREALQVTSYVCIASYPVEEIYRSPLTENQLGRLYDYLVGELVACLKSRGFDVDASTAPSRQTFIESYGEPGTAASWSPYIVVVESNPTEAEWYEIQKACPQSPADLYG